MLKFMKIGKNNYYHEKYKRKVLTIVACEIGL